MARIESETVFNVELDAEEILRLSDGGSVKLDLPTGDTITLDGTEFGTDLSESNSTGGSPGVANEEAAEEVEEDDTSLDEIEQLVRESEKEARENRGTDVDPEDVPDEEEQEGNNEGGGIISVERGG